MKDNKLNKEQMDGVSGGINIGSTVPAKDSDEPFSEIIHTIPRTCNCIGTCNCIKNYNVVIDDVCID